MLPGTVVPTRPQVPRAASERHALPSSTSAGASAVVHASRLRPGPAHRASHAASLARDAGAGPLAFRSLPAIYTDGSFSSWRSSPPAARSPGGPRFLGAIGAAADTPPPRSLRPDRRSHSPGSGSPATQTAPPGRPTHESPGRTRTLKGATPSPPPSKRGLARSRRSPPSRRLTPPSFRPGPPSYRRSRSRATPGSAASPGRPAGPWRAPRSHVGRARRGGPGTSPLEPPPDPR